MLHGYLTGNRTARVMERTQHGAHARAEALPRRPPHLSLARQTHSHTTALGRPSACTACHATCCIGSPHYVYIKDWIDHACNCRYFAFMYTFWLYAGNFHMLLLGLRVYQFMQVHAGTHALIHRAWGASPEHRRCADPCLTHGPGAVYTPGCMNVLCAVGNVWYVAGLPMSMLAHACVSSMLPRVGTTGF